MTKLLRRAGSVAGAVTAVALVAAAPAAAAPANPSNISHHSQPGNGPFNVASNCGGIVSVMDGAYRACTWHQGNHVKSGFIFENNPSYVGGGATIKYYDAWDLAASPSVQGHYDTWLGSFEGAGGERIAVWTDYYGPSAGYGMHTTVLFEGGDGVSPWQAG